MVSNLPDKALAYNRWPALKWRMMPVHNTTTFSPQRRKEHTVSYLLSLEFLCVLSAIAPCIA
jgi:hypothetical protein